MDTTTSASTFAALLHAHRKIVLKVAATYAWTEADRADLAQEIATQLWSAYPRYDRQRPLTTWMYQVALNTAIAHARAASTQWRHFASDRDAEVAQSTSTTGSTEETEAQILRSQAMALLGREDRALLLLHLEAHSSAEIAAILGLSATNVTTRLTRIRQRLSAQLA